MIRSYDRPDGLVTQTHTHVPIIGTAPANYETQEVGSVRRGVFIGTSTPDYTRMLKRGLMLPLNPFTRFDYTEDRPHGMYGGTYNKVSAPPRKYFYSTNAVRVVYGASSSLDLAVDHITRMAKDTNVQSLQQSAVAACAGQMDPLTTLAELPSTISMILGVRKRALDLITRAKRGGFDTAKAASEAWLEWRYGWRLLIKDIDDIQKVISEPLRDNIVTGRSGVSVKEEVSTRYPFSGYHAEYDNLVLLKRDLSIRVHAQASLLVHYGRLNVMINPLLTAWELIPFSFVADWFVSVGTALQALDVNVRSERVETSLGYKFKEEGVATPVDITVGTGTYAVDPIAWGYSKSLCQVKIRAPLGAYTPTLPIFNLALTWQRVMDAIALLMVRIH